MSEEMSEKRNVYLMHVIGQNHELGGNVPKTYLVESENFMIAGNGSILQFVNYKDPSRSSYDTVAIFPVARTIVYSVTPKE